MNQVEFSRTKSGDVIAARMDELGLSIKDVAAKCDVTYEHIRGIVRGYLVPSKYLLPQLAKVLKTDQHDLDKLATADKIRMKYGKITVEMAGKNPELEPLEKVWDYLSEEHKTDLISMAQTYAKRDRAEKRAS